VTHDETAIYAPIAVIATFIVGPGNFNRGVALDPWRASEPAALGLPLTGTHQWKPIVGCAAVAHNTQRGLATSPSRAPAVLIPMRAPALLTKLLPRNRVF
jgi:hypothetical protein